MIADLPPGWQAFAIATYGASAIVILYVAIFIVPDLWREGQAQVRVWLTPDHPKVVSIEQRRQQLAAAPGKRAS